MAVSGLQDLASNVFPSQSTLPVSLLSFSAAYRNGSTVISWETENEVNFSHYELGRKTETAADYTTIDSKTAKGNSTVSSYQSTDNISSLTADVVYYRLKMVDNDGKFKYSQVVMVRKEKKSLSGISINPNPVLSGASTTVRLESERSSQVSLRVLDMAGRQVLQQQNNITSGTNSIQVNNLNKAATRFIHLIQLVNGNEQTTVKFSIVK